MKEAFFSFVNFSWVGGFLQCVEKTKNMIFFKSACSRLTVLECGRLKWGLTLSYRTKRHKTKVDLLGVIRSRVHDAIEPTVAGQPPLYSHVSLLV